MSFSFSSRRGRFAPLVLAAAAIGCGSDSSSAPGGIACAAGQFILAGTLDGQAVSYHGTVTGHAWMQLGSTNSLDASSDPTASVHAEWANLVADGGTTAITGTVTMPSDAPHAGETLNANSGRLTKLTDEVRFEYAELSASVTCIQAPCPATPVSGSIDGCLNWTPAGP